MLYGVFFFFFSSRRRHTRCSRDWSSDVCSSDLQHDDDAVALDHTKRRGVVPETLITEAELVAVVVCGADYVIDDEVRGTAPALAVLHDVVPIVLSLVQDSSGYVMSPRCLTDRA